MCLGSDVVKSFSFVLVATVKVVWRTDPDESVCVEGCEGARLDVCPVSWMKTEGDGNETDVVERMVVAVEEKWDSEVFDWMLVHQLPLGVWLVVKP